MTIEELADRIETRLSELTAKFEARFNELSDKIDTINTTVALHGQTLSTHDRENKQNKDEHREIEDRITKLEKWMWLSIGAGGAAGVGIAKLFM